MNICLVSQEYLAPTAHGGIGTQTFNKARWLARLGHIPHVVTCQPGSGSAVVVERHSPVTIHYLPRPAAPADVDTFVWESSAYWMAYSAQVARYVEELSQHITFNVVDFADYGAEGFAYLSAPAHSAAAVVQLHGCLAMCSANHGWPEPDSDLYRIGTGMEDMCLKRADALMACSVNIADFTARRHGVPRSSIEVVHCGVDCEMFHPADGADPTRPTILFVGEISESKGAHVVFEAALRLRSRHPRLRLVMAGRTDDALAEELRARAEKDARDMVDFLGFVPHSHLPHLYRQAHVFASVADHENGVANVYLEAMASGCPVVAAAAGGAPEAVISGTTGFLVPPSDVCSTTIALDRILSDRALRRELSRSSRAWAETQFGMDTYVRKVLGVYGRAVNESWPSELRC